MNVQAEIPGPPVGATPGEAYAYNLGACAGIAAVAVKLYAMLADPKVGNRELYLFVRDVARGVVDSVDRLEVP